MNLYDLLQSNSGVNITINAGQLIEAIDYAVSKTKAEFEEKQQPEQYITRKQTAEILDIDLSTLWRYGKEGYLQAVEVGGKRKFRLSDIQRILNGGTSHE